MVLERAIIPKASSFCSLRKKIMPSMNLSNGTRPTIVTLSGPSKMIISSRLNIVAKSTITSIRSLSTFRANLTLLHSRRSLGDFLPSASAKFIAFQDA